LPAKSKTFSSLVPERKRIANNSWSDSLSGPYLINFSLGLSIFGKSLIVILFF